MNQDEPLLVNAAEEILNQRDIPNFDFARRIKTEKIVQRVTAVTEHRRTTQAFRNLMPRRCEHSGNACPGLSAAPDVCMSEITQQNHGPFTLSLILNCAGRKGWQISNGLADAF